MAKGAEIVVSDSRLSPAVHRVRNGHFVYAFGSSHNQQDQGQARLVSDRERADREH